jgi:hypothetical protein
MVCYRKSNRLAECEILAFFFWTGNSERITKEKKIIFTRLFHKNKDIIAFMKLATVSFRIVHKKCFL